MDIFNIKNTTFKYCNFNINIEKIEIFLFNKDNYNGAVGNIIEIKNIDFKYD